MRRLIVNPGTGNAWEIPLQPGVFSIGRNPENNIPLEHPSISGEHCLLTVTDAGVIVKDLGSTNGTFIDDAPADETLFLPGQTLRLGDVMLQLESVPDQAPAVSRGKTGSGAAAGFCKIHPREIAHFHCPRCGHNFCDLCVNMRWGRTFCRACSVECESLAVAPISEETGSSFVAAARGAFRYPLQGDGIILLVTGTFFLMLLDAARFVVRFAFIYGLIAFVLLTIFGTGYLTAYLRRILTGTAMGEKRMPDWPEFTEFGSVASPFFQLLGIVVFSFAPAIGLTIYALTAAEGGPWLGWTTTAAIIFGCLYFPMAFLAVAMFDSIGAVNPLLIIPTILKVPGEYLVTVGLLALMLLLRWLGNAFLPEILPVPLLPSILSNLLGLYLLTVEMRILGLLYWTKRRTLGWFRQ
ncbi:MAG TPA: FHA domain-containing protein [Puia sp.]|nr:FHA domain-containing protein [Puia sp.]